MAVQGLRCEVVGILRGFVVAEPARFLEPGEGVGEHPGGEAVVRVDGGVEEVPLVEVVVGPVLATAGLRDLVAAHGEDLPVGRGDDRSDLPPGVGRAQGRRAGERHRHLVAGRGEERPAEDKLDEAAGGGAAIGDAAGGPDEVVSHLEGVADVLAVRVGDVLGVAAQEPRSLHGDVVVAVERGPFVPEPAFEAGTAVLGRSGHAEQDEPATVGRAQEPHLVRVLEGPDDRDVPGPGRERLIGWVADAVRALGAGRVG